MTISTIALRKLADVTSANDVGESRSTSALNADLVSAFRGGPPLRTIIRASGSKCIVLKPRVWDISE